MKNIVVIGSINIDLVTNCDHFPTVGESMFASDFNIFCGGKGANQAVCAAKLDQHVSMVAAVGDDANGKIALANLDKYNIDTSYIKISNEPTGVALIIVANNDNQIVVVKGANAKVDHKVIDDARELIEKADIVMLQLEIPIASVEYIIELCANKRIPVILNPAPYQAFNLNLIDKLTYITPNQIEIKQMFDQDPFEVLAKYPNKMIMTAGSDGVYYHDGDMIKHVAPQKVKAVDTTGAGDTFNGAFAVGIVNDMSMLEAIDFAQKAAAIAITKMGAQTAMPTLVELNKTYQ